MTRFTVRLTMIAAAICFGFFGVGFTGRAVAWQQTHEIPPPPPPTYHPAPGPFVAHVDQQGLLTDRGVITNALQQWGGPQLSAFSICFQPTTKPTDWALAFDALASAAHELQAQGAAVVVLEAGRICASPPKPLMAGKPHVEITGVIRIMD